MNREQLEQLLLNRKSEFEIELIGGYYVVIKVSDAIVFRETELSIYEECGRAVRISYNEILKIIIYR